MDETEQAMDFAAMHDRALYVWEGRGNWNMGSAAHKATSYTAFEMAWDAICEEFLRRDRVVAANAWDEADARLTEWHESKKGHWDNESRPGYRIWVDHPKPANPYRITEENN